MIAHVLLADMTLPTGHQACLAPGLGYLNALRRTPNAKHLVPRAIPPFFRLVS